MIWIIIEEITKEADIVVAGVLIAVLIYFAGMVRIGRRGLAARLGDK